LSLQLQLFSVILRRIATHKKEKVILNKCVHVSHHISVLLKACCDWSVDITVFIGCLCVQSSHYKKIHFKIYCGACWKFTVY